jgi:hypothetical protein
MRNDRFATNALTKLNLRNSATCGMGEHLYMLSRIAQLWQAFCTPAIVEDDHDSVGL